MIQTAIRGGTRFKNALKFPLSSSSSPLQMTALQVRSASGTVWSRHAVALEKEEILLVPPTQGQDLRDTNHVGCVSFAHRFGFRQCISKSVSPSSPLPKSDGSVPKT